MFRRILTLIALVGAIASIGVAAALASENESVGLFDGIANGTCLGANDFSQPRGFVTRHVKNDGTVLYTVHVRDALPNTAYFGGVRCVILFTTPLVTNSNGVGNQTYSFATTS